MLLRSASRVACAPLMRNFCFSSQKPTIMISFPSMHFSSLGKREKLNQNNQHVVLAKEVPACASYAHMVEKLMDEISPSGVYPLVTAGMGWMVERPLPEQELYHWSDETAFPDQIVRVKCMNPNDKIFRFAEIHFKGRFILLHQHDANDPFYSPPAQVSNIEEEMRKVGLANIEKSIPSLSDPVTIYFGTDINSDWMLGLKMVRWPKLYVPHYEVNYANFFERSALMKHIQKDSKVKILDSDLARRETLLNNLWQFQ